MTATRTPRFLPKATRATLHALRGELNILAGAGALRADADSRRAVLRIGQLADELEWRLFVSDRAPVSIGTLDLRALAAEVALELQAAGYPLAWAETGAGGKPIPVAGNAWLVREALNLLSLQALHHLWSGAAPEADAPVIVSTSARARAVILTWRGELEGPLRRVPVRTFFRPVEEQPGAVRGFALGLYSAQLLATRLGGRVTFERRLALRQCRSRLSLPEPRSEA